jgi:hypothetical protein
MDRIIERNHRLIASRLTPHAFSSQWSDDDFYLVRPSHKNGLFERIEMLGGLRQDSFLIAMSLSIVHSVRIGFRGHRVGGGLAELCTHPTRDDLVVFDSAADAERWLDRLTAAAPSKLRAFADARGDQFLSETAAARAEALRVFSEVVRPVLDTDGLKALAALPPADQRELIRRLHDRPFVLGTDDLRAEYEAAVTALVLVDDADLVRLGATAFRLTDDPLQRIDQMKEVSDATMQRIRLIVDLIVQHQSTN